MPKLEAAIAAALSLLLLVSCSGGPPVPENAAAEAGGNRSQIESPAVPAQPDPPANSTDGPPPDAVSHPNGYLPPLPAEPGATGANASGTDATPPATEDEYIRNQQ
jgi:hypothetical protein